MATQQLTDFCSLAHMCQDAVLKAESWQLLNVVVISNTRTVVVIRIIYVYGVHKFTYSRSSYIPVRQVGSNTLQYLSTRTQNCTCTFCVRIYNVLLLADTVLTKGIAWVRWLKHQYRRSYPIKTKVHMATKSLALLVLKILNITKIWHKIYYKFLF